jgi:tetratricopeptide (TPR) repeat protein
VLGYTLLCDVLAFQGEYERAIATCETAWTKSRSPTALAFLARANFLGGNESEARRIEAQIKDLARQRYVSPLDMARLYAGIGEDELAIEWLRRGVEMRVGWISGIGVDRTFEHLRKYPEFQELLARLNLT